MVTILDDHQVYISSGPNHKKGRKITFSHISPHKEVVSSTISGWLKTMLCLSGVDRSVFKEHSTRAASTSMVGLKGL